MDVLISIPLAQEARFKAAMLRRGGYNPQAMAEHQAISEEEFVKRTVGALLGDFVRETEAIDESERILNETRKSRPPLVIGVT